MGPIKCIYRHTLSWPAVSQIWALMVFPSTCILLVANSTPIVDLLSKLNSFLVNLDKRLLLPTPESPMSTTILDERIERGSNEDEDHGRGIDSKMEGDHLLNLN